MLTDMRDCSFVQITLDRTTKVFTIRQSPSYCFGNICDSEHFHIIDEFLEPFYLVLQYILYIFAPEQTPKKLLKKVKHLKRTERILSSSMTHKLRCIAEKEREALATAEAAAEKEREALATAEASAEKEREALATAEASAEKEREALAAAEASAEKEREALAAAEASAEKEREALAAAEAALKKEKEARKAAKAMEKELKSLKKRLRANSNSGDEQTNVAEDRVSSNKKKDHVRDDNSTVYLDAELIPPSKKPRKDKNGKR
jgi:hypothetical protein